LDPSGLVFSSVCEAVVAIRRGDVTSLELTELIFNRIDRFNPAINAIVTLMRDEALACAREADEALARGEVWGPLHGVPISIKDCFKTAGVRTTAGSRSISDNVPEEDAVAVARLRAAGAVIIGHSNVPVMAGDWQSYNRVFGTTNNPWDLGRTPGGSTGGGAAALAAGLSFLSLGSDIGGSIRVPSHFCGVYGHRPSVNVVPLEGYIPAMPYSPQIQYVAGPLARSAEDLRLAMEILGGPGADDAVAYSWSMPQERGASLTDYRLGYVLDHPACPVSSCVKGVMADAVESLRGEGVDISEGWPEGVDPVGQHATYRFLLGSWYASSLKDEEFEETRRRASDQDGSYEAIRNLALTAPHKLFHRALKERVEAREAWRRYFEHRDAFLLPVSFLPAFPHDHSQPFWGRVLQTPEGPRRYEDLMFWISFATLTGLPATVAPIGKTGEGLPVGIQIIGPYLEDATPIDVAARMAKVTGGFEPPGGYGEPT
jgi:amidase